MSRVYVTSYEVIGDGAAIYAPYRAEVDAAKDAHWKFSKSVGGIGFRPDSMGGVRSVFFKELPSGWRKVGKHGANIEAVPRKGAVVTREVAKAMADLPRAPQPSKLAADFGYKPSQMALDGDRGVIYFPTELQTQFPETRTFLRLPRFSGDEFEPDPALLRALPESEFMQAIEAHNAEVTQKKGAA